MDRKSTKFLFGKQLNNYEAVLFRDELIFRPEKLNFNIETTYYSLSYYPGNRLFRQQKPHAETGETVAKRDHPG